MCARLNKLKSREPLPGQKEKPFNWHALQSWHFHSYHLALRDSLRADKSEGIIQDQKGPRKALGVPRQSLVWATFSEASTILTSPHAHIFTIQYWPPFCTRQCRLFNTSFPFFSPVFHIQLTLCHLPPECVFGEAHLLIEMLSSWWTLPFLLVTVMNDFTHSFICLFCLAPDLFHIPGLFRLCPSRRVLFADFEITWKTQQSTKKDEAPLKVFLYADVSWVWFSLFCLKTYILIYKCSQQ